MFLLEHDAKALLAAGGIAVPAGVFTTGGDVLAPGGDGPGWVVKAQVLAGGRGKQGGIKLVPSWAEAERETAAMLGRSIGAHQIRAVRIEQQVPGAVEAYLSFSVAAAERGVRVLLSGTGGVEIETLHQSGSAVLSAISAPVAGEVAAVVAGLAGKVGGVVGAALAEAGASLAKLFFAHDLMLLEINPLFVRPDGSWCAGDAKIVADDNAAPRQTFFRDLLAEKASFYADAARKAVHDFDYLVIDPDGEIGLVTTGAGLSMLLIDELRADGMRPYNFLDVRTGGMHGDPARLIQVLRWLAEGSKIRAVFCNIFAGSTDLGAFAKLLLLARAAVPELAAPLVIRLVGNNEEEARKILGAAGLSMTNDLAEAVTSLRQALA